MTTPPRSPPPSRPTPGPFERLATKEVRYLGEIHPSIHAYGMMQAMHRVRAYQTAGLNPHAARGLPREELLVGHVHTDAEGKAALIEGFNGREGERFAERATAALAEEGLLAAGHKVAPTQGLRLCPATGYR